MDNKRAAIYGTAAAWTYLGVVEVMDGYSSEWGFSMAYWPHVYDLIQKDMEITTSNSTPFAQNIELLDQYIGQIIDKLEEQGILENTLIVCMADNGPMKEVPNAMYQVIFNGGKGDYKEGGIRVAAFAQWEGTMEAGEVVGDMIRVHDLFTTFARIGGATEYIPRDRIIDGIDQTAVLLEGDGNSRRDYYLSLIHISEPTRPY